MENKQQARTPAIPDNTELRENVRLQYQVELQIQAYRDAANTGNLEGMGRSSSCLTDLLWAEMPQADKDEYESHKFKTVLKSDLYTDSDKKTLKDYALPKKRLMALRSEMVSRNMAEYERCVRNQFRISMFTVKRLKLGFRTAIEERANDKDSVAMSKIRDRVFKDKANWLALFVGTVGTGKSYSALKLCQLLDKGFDLSRVVFTEGDLMKLVRSKLPPGSCIVADEIGATFDDKSYMTESNRILSRLIQTFRNRRLIIFWTVPHARQVDITLRTMVNSVIETVRINKKARETVTKFKLYKMNLQNRNKPYVKFPERPRPGLDSADIVRFIIQHPDDGPEGSKGLGERYDNKKNRWQDVMYERDEERLRTLTHQAGERRERRAKPTRDYVCNKCGHTGKTTRPRTSCSRCLTRDVTIR